MKKTKTIKFNKEYGKNLDILLDNLENHMNVDYIHIYENVLTSDECKEYISLFEKYKSKGLTKKGGIGRGNSFQVNLNKKTSDDLFFYPDEDNKEGLNRYVDLHEKISIYLYAYLLNVGFLDVHYVGLNLEQLKERVKKENRPTIPSNLILEPVKLRKYDKGYGGYHIPHFDKHKLNDGATGHGGERLVAAILYLNDMEFGGETSFPIIKRNIKPKAGRLLMFPAYFTHLHYAKKSEYDKYVLVFHIMETYLDKLTKKGK